MIPYEAIVYHTGDIRIKIANTTYELEDDLWSQLNNYDIVLEDNEVTAVVGAMTPAQYRELLVKDSDLY